MSQWEKELVKSEFRVGSIEPLVKLSGTLTGSKELTKKAKEFIASIVKDNLAEQRKIEMRQLVLANRCLLEDINPVATGLSPGSPHSAQEPS